MGDVLAPEALLALRNDKPTVVKKPLPDMYDLPFEYPEEPGLPDIYHAHQGVLLSETLELPDDHLSAMDHNVYYDKTHTGRHKRPDWFLALGVNRTYKGDLRRSFVVWKEEANPFLIVELVSDSTIEEDYGIKKSEPDKFR